VVQKARKQLEKEGQMEAPVEEQAEERTSDTPGSGFDFTNFLRGTGTSSN